MVPLRILLVTCSLLLLGMVPLRSNDLSGVIVQEKEGVYRVVARFVVPQAPGDVLQVLTDYESIPRFMPDVKSSIVRSRGDGLVVVEQEAERRVMMFSKRLYLLLDIRELPDALIFVDRSGRSFTSYEGSWRVAPAGGQTQVDYQLSATPAFDVPKFVLMRLLRGDAANLIARLQTEIAARAAR